MKSVNITLRVTEPLKDAIDKCVDSSSGAYSNRQDYIRRLIIDDLQKRKILKDE